jgi:hypothetical protein
MKTIKHIGRMKNTGAKVVVVFRCLPGEINSALVIPTANLSDAYHDALMTVLESDQGQQAFEFGEVMHIRHFPDGRPMLVAMQQDGRMQKVSTDSVVMNPTHNTNIPLSDLNVLIAEQKNVAIDDLPYLVAGAKSKDREVVVEERKASTQSTDPVKSPSNEPLSDKDLARSYRSQADAMYKEAARLRREADDLDPPQKKTATKVKEEAGA